MSLPVAVFLCFLCGLVPLGGSFELMCGPDGGCKCYSEPGIVMCLHRHLEDIPYEGFDVMTQLTTRVLDLKYNDITSFDLDVHIWPGISLIDVRHNPINCTWLMNRKDLWRLVDSDCEHVMKDFDFFGELYNKTNEGDFYEGLLGGDDDDDEDDPPSDNEDKPKTKDNKAPTIAGLVIGIILLAIIVVIILYVHIRSLRRKRGQPAFTIVRDMTSGNVPAQVAFFSEAPDRNCVD